mgnify:CR=1 FL=1
MAHAEVYAEQFGWNTDFEAFVARIVADYANAHHPTRRTNLRRGDLGLCWKRIH